MTLKVKITCTPEIYFDSLRYIILTNDISDLGGDKESGQWVEDLFSAKRVVALNVKRQADNFFYVDSVGKRAYMYFTIGAELDRAPYSGFKRDIDFRKISGDTTEIEICFTPVSIMMSQ